MSTAIAHPDIVSYHVAAELHTIDLKTDWSRDLAMPPCVERTLALLCRYVDCLQQQTPPPFSHYTDQLERDFSLQGAQEPLQLRMIQVLQMQALQEKFASDHISKIELAAQYLNAKNYPNGLDILISLFKNITRIRY